MRGTSRKRPWLAALLALIYPGLGHIYLREWARSILWFGLVVATASLLIPESAVPATPSLESLTRAWAKVPGETTLALGGVTGISVVDAYWMATRTNRRRARGADGTHCPNCERELDDDLKFCHWCTTELDDGEETERPTEA